MLIRKMGAIPHAYRHIKRYRQILSILFKYGGDLVSQLPVGRVLERSIEMISRSRRQRMEKLTRFERIRMAVEELGPTFVKLAQALSTRPDLIPLEFVDELAKLQDQVPSFPFLEVKEIIEGELHAPLEANFPNFEEIPLAAASIGQVHRARLPGGEEVVVKVQRPRIRKIIEADLEILYHLATLFAGYVEEEWGIQKPARIVEEMARTMEKEIDYKIEAAHAERFARHFADDPTIRVPRVYEEYSTARVLTLEYIPGIKVSEIVTLKEEGLDPKVIAARGAELILKQIFQFGFFHADPHPGNIFILPGNVICYLDFGMMGSVDRQGREDFADFVYGYVRRDESRITEALLRFVERDEEPDRRRLEKDIAELLEIYHFETLKELQISRVLKQVLELLARYRLRFPSESFLMIKAMATTEGVGTMLDPEFNMVAKAAPFIRRVIGERRHPRRVIEEFIDIGGDVIQLLKHLPGNTDEILRQIKDGRFRIGFEHKGLEDFAIQVHRSTNRMAFALIISSLIVGSSLIIQRDIGPYVFGFPILGLFGFIIAGIFGIVLLISILRRGRL